MAENSISYGIGLSDQMINQMLQSDDPSIVAQAQNYVNQAKQKQEQKPNLLQKIGSFFNIGEAGAAEPNINNTGIISASNALPFTSMADMYDRSQIDLVDQINQGPRNINAPMTLEETMAGSVVPPDPRRFQSIFPTEKIAPLDMNRFQGVSDMSIIDETTNDEQDQGYIDQVNEDKESGIMKLIKFLIPGSNLANFLPQESPEIKNIKNFYRQNYGLDSIGRVDSGIMKGYNPVSGSDFLNKITGGFFPAQQFGLADAARRRINRIANRRLPQTDASRAKIAALQDFARADTISRGRKANPDVYKKAESLGLIDKKTGGFKSTGTNENFSNTTGRGRTGY